MKIEVELITQKHTISLTHSHSHGREENLCNKLHRTTKKNNNKPTKSMWDEKCSDTQLHTIYNGTFKCKSINN